jgi:ankyrin repeat protein
VSGATVLIGATSEGHADVVTILLEHGVGVNQTNREGCTPVVYASDYGHPATLKVLLEHGGDVNKVRTGEQSDRKV